MLPTTVYRRMVELESPVKETASQIAQYSMRQAESVDAQPTEEETTAIPAAPLMPVSNGIDLSVTDAPDQDVPEAAVTVEPNDLLPMPEIIPISPEVYVNDSM